MPASVAQPGARRTLSGFYELLVVSGQSQFSVRKVDDRLFAGEDVRLGRILLTFRRLGEFVAGGGYVDFLERKRFIDEDGDAIGQRLHEAFARRELQTLGSAALDDIRAQHARFECAQKRGVMREYAFFTFGSDCDHQIGVAVEDHLRRRDEFERNHSY